MYVCSCDVDLMRTDMLWRLFVTDEEIHLGGHWNDKEYQEL